MWCLYKFQGYKNRTVRVVFEGGSAIEQSTLPSCLPVHLQHIDADVRDLVTMRLESTGVAKAAQTEPVGILESDDDLIWGHLYTDEGDLMQSTDSWEYVKGNS